jgi:hypothetical protein
VARIALKLRWPLASVLVLTFLAGVLDAAPGGATYPFDPRDALAQCLTFKSGSDLPQSEVEPDVDILLVMVKGHLLSLFPCSEGGIVVELTPGSQALAQQIRARFGHGVKVFIGSSTPNPPVNCLPLLKTRGTPSGLKVSLHLNSRTVPAGGSFSGYLKISYNGPHSFEMDTGQPLVAELLERGTRRVVGFYHGGTVGTGYQSRISAGESYRVNVIGGSNSCEHPLSPLRAGKYEAVVVVMGETGLPPRYLTPPMPIRVTNS